MPFLLVTLILYGIFLDSLNSALDQVTPYRFVSARNSVSTSKARTALRYKRRCDRYLMLKPSIDNLISYKRSKLITRRTLDENIAVRKESNINAKNQKIFGYYVNRHLGSDSRIKFIAQDVCTHDSQEMADLLVNSYVIQSTVLGPALFNIFVNDIDVNGFFR